MTLFKTLLFTILVSLSVSTFSQYDENASNNPKQNMELGNYKVALKQYKELLAKNPDDMEINNSIGICYLNLNLGKEKAIPFLEKAFATGKAPNSINYDLGLAYHLTNNFDKAEKKYKQFLANSRDQKANENVERQIEMLNNAKEFMKYPLNVKFENLGNTVNSEYPDYNPYVYPNESFLVFATKRYGTTGNYPDFDGFNTPDLYVSNIKNGKFQKASNMGNTINTELNEVPSGISSDGEFIFYNIDNYSGSGDIWTAQRAKRGNSYMPGKKLNSVINKDESFELGATQTADGNILFFSSSKAGGFGGNDLYYSKKLPSGEWGVPVNLGGKINTKYDEVYPQLSHDEKTLYFSSEGHTSMGGFDIFKTNWDTENDSIIEVKNLGYPVNNTDDQMSYCPTETERFGYIAAYRPEGLGDLDIYRIVYNQVDPKFTIITGKLYDSDTSQTGIITAFITVINKEDNENFGLYEITPIRKNKYVMALPPGEYKILIEADDFKMKIEDMTILDKASFIGYIDKNFYLENTKPKPVIKPKESSTSTDKGGISSSSYPKNQVIFKVQVGKNDQVFDETQLSLLFSTGFAKEILKGNVAVYTKGFFKNSNEALKLAAEMKTSNSSIFPIAILNGEKIPLQAGIEYQKKHK